MVRFNVFESDDLSLEAVEPEPVTPPAEQKPEKSGSSNTIAGYPKGAFFCLGSDFAERFSYHTCRALLVAFLMTVHNVQEKEAEFFYHMFVVFCYLTPICGSLIADGCLGRFWVIIFVSIIHCFGHVLMCVGAIQYYSLGTTITLNMIALVLIGIGTGGIRSCASCFMGDQFPSTMLQERRKFVAFFYLTVMLGAVLAEYIGPLLKKVKCSDEGDTCYPLAFGFPALIVVAGFIVFLCGIRYYMFVKYDENVLCRVIKCLLYSIYKSFLCCGRCRTKRDQEDDGKMSTMKMVSKPSSWLDPAEELYGPQLVTDIRTLWSMMNLFLIGVPFWALYDQEGSSWFLQANKMDGTIGAITLLPEQISLLGPMFVCAILPFMILAFYPFAWSHNFLVTPLRRMGYGGLMAALSFVCAGVLQIALDNHMEPLPPRYHVRGLVINYGPCTVTAVDSSINRNSSSNVTTGVRIEPGDHLIRDYKPPVYLKFDSTCIQYMHRFFIRTPILWISEESQDDWSKIGHFAVFWDRGPQFYTNRTFNLHRKGNCRFHAIAHPEFLQERANASIILQQAGSVIMYPLSKDMDNFSISPSFFTRLIYDISLQECVLDDVCYETPLADNKTMKMGSQYILAFDRDRKRRKFIELVKPNPINMLWMIPQYFFMSLSEVMLVLGGSEFAYSQAAPSMKSTVHSTWLLSVAAGNALVAFTVITDVLGRESLQFFFYASIMTLAVAVFAYQSRTYQYLDRSKIKYAKSDRMPGEIPGIKDAATGETTPKKNSARGGEADDHPPSKKKSSDDDKEENDHQTKRKKSGDGGGTATDQKKSKSKKFKKEKSK